LLDSITIDLFKEAAEGLPIHIDKEKKRLRIWHREKYEVFIIYVYEREEEDDFGFEVYPDYCSVNFPYKTIFENIVNRLEEYIKETLQKDPKWRLIAITSDKNKVCEVDKIRYIDILKRIKAEFDCGKNINYLKKDYLLNDEELEEILFK
jgi:hypothetical protein